MRTYFVRAPGRGWMQTSMVFFYAMYSKLLGCPTIMEGWQVAKRIVYDPTIDPDAPRAEAEASPWPETVVMDEFFEEEKINKFPTPLEKEFPGPEPRCMDLDSEDGRL